MKKKSKVKVLLKTLFSLPIERFSIRADWEEALALQLSETKWLIMQSGEEKIRLLSSRSNGGQVDQSFPVPEAAQDRYNEWLEETFAKAQKKYSNALASEIVSLLKPKSDPLELTPAEQALQAAEESKTGEGAAPATSGKAPAPAAPAAPATGKAPEGQGKNQTAPAGKKSGKKQGDADWE